MLSLAVVCEAEPDRHTGCHLADRVVVDQVQWIEEELLDALRQWRGPTPAEPCLLWRRVRELAGQRGIRAHGHFEGEPGAPDAAAARRALLLLHAAEPRPDAVVLLRDDDGEGDRRKGLEQARGAARIGVPIVLGVARTKRECWVLAGFEPSSEQEKRLLQEVRQGLGFNPCEHPERLTAHGRPGAKRDAKQVLDEVTAADHARQEACWTQSDLAVLKDRGRGCGLAEYLDEVRGHLVPLFTARGSRSQ